MDGIKGVLALLGRFDQRLVASRQKLRCFTDSGVQVEGWLKGEMLCFLTDEKNSGRLNDFDREVPCGIGRKRIDFMLQMGTAGRECMVWMELKHWLIGKQKGNTYDARFYFRDKSSVGIRPDAEKLSRMQGDLKVIMILATSNPGKDNWYGGLQDFNTKFSPLQLRSHTDPEDSGDDYFLGLLELVAPDS